MNEYFLTAFVSEGQVERARSILQGVCCTSGSHQFQRLLVYSGPDRPDGFRKIKDFEKTPNSSLFTKLQKYISKQSYLIRLQYPVSEREFGNPEPSELLDLDKKQGTLEWTDLPDPVHGDVRHLHRNILRIPMQDKLISLLEQNAHVLKTEFVREFYSYGLDNVEYVLSRDLAYPAGFVWGPGGSLRNALPPRSELQPISSLWTLHAKVLISEPLPELSDIAVDLLNSAIQTLGRCFDFQRIDRFAFDSRVQVTPVRQTMPQPLPAVVPVDKQA